VVLSLTERARVILNVNAPQLPAGIREFEAVVQPYALFNLQIGWALLGFLKQVKVKK